MPDTCVYMWEFMVEDARRVEFEHHYGPRGTWAHFSAVAGLPRHGALRAKPRPRYLNRSLAERRRIARFAPSRRGISALDLQCEALTREERALGCFTEIAS